MPYNPGTGIYTLPAIYLAIPGTTILAAQHNTPLEDLEVANNYNRPVVAGGTGQNSALLARGSTGLATSGNIGVKGSNVASAATLTLVDNFNYFHVTGAVAITAISTRPAGERILFEFEGAPLLTHNATSLILIGGASFTVGAGDVAEFVSEGAGNWRMADYSRAAGYGPTVTTISVTGTTWTKKAGCRIIVIEAQGGGGAGGNVDGQGAGTAGAGGGGASGFYGKTDPIDVTAVVSAVATIGAGGAVSGSASGTGGGGGPTAITIGATTYTFAAGSGGGGMAASGTPGGSQDGGSGGAGTNVVGFSQPGGIGVYAGGSSNSTGGNGGSSGFGTGGTGPHLLAPGQLNGIAALGFGAGGAGGCTCETSNNATGSAGRPGYMRIWEYY